MCGFPQGTDSMPSPAGDGGHTRREALRLAAGGGALALIAAGMGRPAVFAQPASPAPSASKEGLYVVIRSRTVKADASIDKLNTAIRDGLMPLIQAIPGFVEYFVMQNPDTRERTAVSVFTDKAGADQSTTVASDFISGEGGLADSYENVEPVVLEGPIVVAG
jgi:hypothetical protein